MPFPPQLAHLESIAHIERCGARWLFEVAGVRAWYCEYSQGMGVAIKIECTQFDDDWLERASLWLASMRDAIDDAFLLDGDELWFIRRYEAELESAEWVTLFNQQAAIANWLANADRRARREAHERAAGVAAWARATGSLP